MAATLIALEVNPESGEVIFPKNFNTLDNPPTQGPELEKFLGFSEGFYYHTDENKGVFVHVFKAKHDGNGRFIPGRWYIEFGESCA